MSHTIITKIVFTCLLLIGGANNDIIAQSISLDVKNIEQIKNSATGNIEPTAFVGESFILQAIVRDIGQQAQDLSIAGINSFSVASTMRSSNITLINGQQSIEHTYKYTLIPHNEGIFTLGPATIKNKRGQDFSSDTLSIQVIKRPAGYQSPNRKGNQDQSIELFCELKPSKKRVVVGEPVEVIASIYTRGPILKTELASPTFTNFLHKEVMQAKTRQETRDNKVYDVIEKKIVLTPLQAGEMKIDPLMIQCVVRAQRHKARDFFDHTFFDDFFPARAEQRTAMSNDITISVDPLPAHKGKVNGVGEFTTLNATLNKTEAQANEALLFQLIVEGKGNFDQVTAPTLNLPRGFKHYESKNSVQEDWSQDFILGKKTFEYVIQIPTAGNWEIPAQTFTFFDTASGSYRNLQSKPLAISVMPLTQTKPHKAKIKELIDQDDQEKEITAEKKNTPLEKEIHFIQEDGGINKKAAPSLPWWLFIILLFLPTILLSKSMLPFLRKWYYRIFRVSAKKQLDEFDQRIDIMIKKDSVQGLYQLLLSFLATKFDVPASFITHDWVMQKLEDDEIPGEKIQEFMDYLNECAGLHFVTQTKNLAELRSLLKRGKYWIIFLGK
jgi:hypothetical protein